MLRGMWDLPGPGLEPLSPALAGGFLTTAPPGRPLVHGFLTTVPPGKPKRIFLVLRNTEVVRTMIYITYPQMVLEEKKNSYVEREEQSKRVLSTDDKAN